MTDKNKKITVLILGFLIGMIIYLSFKLRNDETDEIINNHYEVVGVISNVGLKTIDVTYTINNNGYLYTQNKPYSGIVAGEEFFTLASKKNLNRALVYYTKPILDTTKYKYKLIKPINIEKLSIDLSEISFTYKVGEIEYDRIQKYEKGARPNDLKKLEVKYRIERPEIGYLVD